MRTNDPLEDVEENFDGEIGDVAGLEARKIDEEPLVAALAGRITREKQLLHLSANMRHSLPYLFQSSLT